MSERPDGAGAGPERAPASAPRIVSALIGLGSNLGNREAHLRRAAERLGDSPRSSGFRLSSIRESAPVAVPGAGPLGGPYLNAAAELLTGLTARFLLELLLAIESELGRVRTGPGSPRTIDLDLLLYGDQVIEEPDLVVPHPRILEREFVLEPLAEIVPGRLHPRSRRTFLEHWEEWRGLRDRHP